MTPAANAGTRPDDPASEGCGWWTALLRCGVLKPPPFEYRLPESLEEALSIMAEYGDEARPLAGGQSLVPLMAFRLARPAVLVDLNKLDTLAALEVDNHQVNVGAMVREKAAERSDTLARRVPLLARALPFIGHEAIRTRGTIGGSLAHADPAAELPAVAVATEAKVVAQSQQRGERTVPAEEFFVTYFTTALAPDELVTQVQFPSAPDGTGVAFEEVARRHGDFAMVGVATTLHAADGVIDQARVVLTGMADKPVRASAAEAVLMGGPLDPAAFKEAAAVAAADLDPPSDLHGSAAYRRHVASVLVERSLEQASAKIGGGR
jgi:carbon-monoxide dehydrogenase medium subunit